MAGVLIGRHDLKQRVESPTAHVLRPHHISLLVLMKPFFDEQTFEMNAKLQLILFDILIEGTAEIVPPPPWSQTMALLESTADELESDESWYLKKVKRILDELNTVDDLTDFVKDIRNLYVDKSEEETSPLVPRSLFGFFCRRCFVSFRKLSYHGVDQLLRGYKRWENGESPSYTFEKVDPLRSESKTWKPDIDKSTWAAPTAFLAFEKAAAANDHHMAEEHLRAFFEQRFVDSGDTDLRQHVLLNLARTHFKWGGYKQALKYIQEAISVARTAGDKVTIQFCMSLFRRWSLTPALTKPPLNEIQYNLPALEVLRDSIKLLTNDQPLEVVFEKIYSSLALLDMTTADRSKYQHPDDQWAPHAIQAVVWRLAGCFQLAEIEDEIVLAHTEVAGNDETRLKTLHARATQIARQGKYEDALSMLLEPDVWRGLEASAYKDWAGEIWNILELRFSRRGSFRIEEEFLKSKRSRVSLLTQPSLDPKKPNPFVEDILRQSVELRRQNRTIMSLDPTLTGLWRAEFLGRFHMYRLGVALLVDASLDLGLTKWARKMMEEIMPQVINGDELELRALSCVVYARSIVLAGDTSDIAIKEAIPFLQLAEQDYAVLEIIQCLSEVQYMLSIFYHNLGMVKERDDAAHRALTSEAKMEEYARATVDSETVAIWKLVEDVGVTLATRDE